MAEQAKHTAGRGDPLLMVAKPRAGEAGCWALVRRYSGSLVAQSTNCGNRNRPGLRTCSRHAALEDAADAIAKVEDR